MKTRRIMTWLTLAVFAVSLVPLPEVARAEEPILSNLSLLDQLTQGAVEEVVSELDLDRGQPVTLLSRTPHEGNFFIRERLATALADAGYDVVTVNTAAEADTVQAEAAKPRRAGQSTGSGAAGNGAAEDSLATLALEEPPAPVPVSTGRTLPDGRYPDGTILDIEVLEFGVRYSEVSRKYLLGPVEFTRVAGVYVKVTELEGERGLVRDMATAERHHWDRVSGRERLLAEGSEYPFRRPDLNAPGLGTYVEPALVVAVVGSLIFLFYENQN